jgi:hypothetical protein
MLVSTKCPNTSKVFIHNTYKDLVSHHGGL